MSEWQPIETAPKDETYVLLWWPYWSSRALLGVYYLGQWRADGALHYEGNAPTHWMPLPEPPDISTQDASGTRDNNATPPE